MHSNSITHKKLLLPLLLHVLLLSAIKGKWCMMQIIIP